MLDRLPIRLRLTLAFAVVMALVLGATGIFLRVRLEASLEDSLERDLRNRANDVALLIHARGGDVGRFTERDDIFLQVVDGGGRVLEATSRDLERPLLPPAEMSRARSGNIFFDVGDVAGREDVTIFARRVRVGTNRFVIVTGASAEDREEAGDSLFRLLLIGGPAALLLASLAGYALAAASLRPVEAMRRRAAEISASTRGERLPLPAAADEIRDLGTTLNAMLARLEATLERERRLVADASHELRTPLAALKAEVELALRQPRPREDLEQALRSAGEETDRLVKLADDLLLLARAEEEGLRAPPAVTRVADVFAAVAASFERRAALAGRSIEWHCRPDLVVGVDPTRLERALANLVANALDHGDGTISLLAAGHDGTVELRVKDQGSGFPSAFLPRAFERFSRPDDARGRGGSGLGLAIVDAVARGHGGSATAANGSEGGAEVWITLPHPRASN